MDEMGKAREAKVSLRVVLGVDWGEWQRRCVVQAGFSDGCSGWWATLTKATLTSYSGRLQ